MYWGGDRTALKKNQMICADIDSLPPDLIYALPNNLSPEARAIAQAHLSPLRTVNGPLDWPSGERLDEGFSAAAGGDDISSLLCLASGLTPAMEAMWYGADKPPAGGIDTEDLHVWLNGWRCRRDFPSWRAGDRPGFFPIDLRPFANHASHPTGKETLEAGRMPEIDLRYVPTGRQVLSGVEFDLIDPARNNGQSVVMVGRPLPGATHPKDAAGVTENTGPIPVGRKLASLAFLYAEWLSSSSGLTDTSFFPTCQVLYDDNAWAVVDCFTPAVDWQCAWNNPVWGGDNWGYLPPMYLLDRMAWRGNCPGGSGVQLKLCEWVNPYPEKMIRSLRLFMARMRIGAAGHSPISDATPLWPSPGWNRSRRIWRIGRNVRIVRRSCRRRPSGNGRVSRFSGPDRTTTTGFT